MQKVYIILPLYEKTNSPWLKLALTFIIITMYTYLNDKPNSVGYMNYDQNADGGIVEILDSFSIWFILIDKIRCL